MTEDIQAKFMHDLRVPLQVIFCCAQLMEAEASPYAALLRESAAEARDMLERYLADWRAGETPFRPVRGDLTGFARSLLRRMELLARQRGVRLAWRSNAAALEAFFDPEKLGRALENLLTNAIAHTPSGGRARLEVAALGDYAELRVADGGEGLSPERLRAALECPETAEGHGLGLVIAREFIEAHGGELLAAACPGEGSVFALRLPLGGNRGGKGRAPEGE